MYYIASYEITSLVHGRLREQTKVAMELMKWKQRMHLWFRRDRMNSSLRRKVG